MSCVSVPRRVGTGRCEGPPGPGAAHRAPARGNPPSRRGPALGGAPSRSASTPPVGGADDVGGGRALAERADGLQLDRDDRALVGQVGTAKVVGEELREREVAALAVAARRGRTRRSRPRAARRRRGSRRSRGRATPARAGAPPAPRCRRPNPRLRPGPPGRTRPPSAGTRGDRTGTRSPRRSERRSRWTACRRAALDSRSCGVVARIVTLDWVPGKGQSDGNRAVQSPTLR